MADPAVPFEVDGASFGDCVAWTGLGWETNDIDSDASGRTRSTTMRRSRLGSKRSLPVKCHDALPYDRAHALTVALDKSFVTIRYLDLRDGICTRTFYGTKIAASAIYRKDGKTKVDGISFTLVER